MNWKGLRERVVEWAVIAILAAAVQHYRDCQDMKITLAQHDVYIDQLWKEKR